jgi:hypothetical protein
MNNLVKNALQIKEGTGPAVTRAATRALKRPLEVDRSEEVPRKQRTPVEMDDQVAGPSSSSPPALGKVQRPHIYKNNEVVYQNKDFRMEILKTQFKKWSRFNIGDHLFILRCVMNNPSSQKPLLSELFQALEESLDTILTEMKKFYEKPDHEHQIFITGNFRKICANV